MNWIKGMTKIKKEQIMLHIMEMFVSILNQMDRVKIRKK